MLGDETRGGGDGRGRPAGRSEPRGHSAEQAYARTRAPALEVDGAPVCSARSSRARCGPRGQAGKGPRRDFQAAGLVSRLPEALG